MNTISNALDVVLQGVVSVALVCTFLASLRIAISGLGHVPENVAVAFFTHDLWAVSVFLLLPMSVGQFARHELSPLPWLAFSRAAARHGIVDGIFSLLDVLTVVLWLLWIPAHSYVLNRPGLDRRTALLARSLNLAFGLLLLTPHNPVYKILDWLSVPGPVDASRQHERGRNQPSNYCLQPTRPRNLLGPEYGITVRAGVSAAEPQSS